MQLLLTYEKSVRARDLLKKKSQRHYSSARILSPDMNVVSRILGWMLLYA